jgi:hypothetical protein
MASPQPGPAAAAARRPAPQGTPPRDLRVGEAVRRRGGPACTARLRAGKDTCPRLRHATCVWADLRVGEEAQQHHAQQQPRHHHAVPRQRAHVPQPRPPLVLRQLPHCHPTPTACITTARRACLTTARRACLTACLTTAQSTPTPSNAGGAPPLRRCPAAPLPRVSGWGGHRYRPVSDPPTNLLNRLCGTARPAKARPRQSRARAAGAVTTGQALGAVAARRWGSS